MPDDTIQDIPPPSTLFGAIAELQEVSWRINNLIFGTTQTLNEKPKDSVRAGDNLTEARNRMIEIIERLEEVARRLETLGV